MKLLIIGILHLLFIVSPVIAQVAPGKYFIKFTDKEHNKYSLSEPGDFLSERALERRKKFSIPIELNDLPVTDIYLDSLHNLGLKILNTSKWFNGAVVQTSDSILIDTLNKVSFIQSTKKTGRQLVPLTNEEYKDDYNFAETYGASWWQIGMLNGHYLHEAGYRGEDMHIAVLDAGFFRVDSLPAFDSLWQNKRIGGYKNFVNDHLGIFNSNYHGMKVLSIMAGNIPGVYVGTAPRATYWLARSENFSSEYTIEEDYWVSAAEFADSAGVDIINSSLGYSTFDDSSQNYSYQDLDGNTAKISIAADIAASKGILVVTSAGNEGNKKWKYITAPADADSVLTVGAVDSSGNYASFSSVGPTSDRRIKPNVAALGYGTIIQYVNEAFGPGSGTSFSSPVIAGLAACLWQAHPGKTNMEIIKAIEASSSQYKNPDSLLGYGIPDFRIADLILKKDNFPSDTLKLANIYPNPFTDQVEIEIPRSSNQNVKIEIYDSIGRKIHHGNVNTGEAYVNWIQINELGLLAEGLYVFKITMDKGTSEKKMIKQK